MRSIVNIIIAICILIANGSSPVSALYLQSETAGVDLDQAEFTGQSMDAKQLASIQAADENLSIQLALDPTEIEEEDDRQSVGMKLLGFTGDNPFLFGLSFQDLFPGIRSNSPFCERFSFYSSFDSLFIIFRVLRI